MALPYPTKVVLPFDIATAQDMNERHANDVALAAGTGLDDSSITASKLAPTILAFGNYSTSEVNTGFTWVNGDTIYKKTVSFGALPDSTTKTVAHGASVKKIIKCEVASDDGVSLTLPIPFVRAVGGVDNIELRLSPTNITIRTNSANFVTQSAYVTIYYTKV